MILIGCKPPGRHIEQHDIFFGIGNSITEIVPQLIQHWPETEGKMHIDGWRQIRNVGSHRISVIPKTQEQSGTRLFFINLGGYKPGEFDEFHYKMIIAAKDKTQAIQEAKASAFYKHTGFPGATSHIDDKYGIDIDDIYDIQDILPASMTAQYTILAEASTESLPEDELHLGYFKLSSFK